MALFAQQRENAENDERRQSDEQIERHRMFLPCDQFGASEAQEMSQGLLTLYVYVDQYLFYF